MCFFRVSFQIKRNKIKGWILFYFRAFRKSTTGQAKVTDNHALEYTNSPSSPGSAVAVVTSSRAGVGYYCGPSLVISPPFVAVAVAVAVAVVVVVVVVVRRRRGRGPSLEDHGGVVVFQFVFLPSQRVWGHPWESGRKGIRLGTAATGCGHGCLAGLGVCGKPANWDEEFRWASWGSTTKPAGLECLVAGGRGQWIWVQGTADTRSTAQYSIE